MIGTRLAALIADGLPGGEAGVLTTVRAGLTGTSAKCPHPSCQVYADERSR